MDEDGSVSIGSDLPHLLHVWREAARTAITAARVSELAQAAARHAEVSAEAARNAATAAQEALLMAGVDVSEDPYAGPHAPGPAAPA